MSEACAPTSWKSDCPMDPMDPSDKRVFHRTKSYPMENKRRHDKQGLIELEMCVSGLLGDCGNLVKVRLSDWSDGSIGQACFPSDKELSDGEKWRHDKQGLIQLGLCASGVLGDCSKVRLSDGSDGSIGQRVFRRTKSYPMEKKWRHEKWGIIRLGMCASGLPGDCGNLVKVRLDPMDPSDKRVFHQTKSYPMEKKWRHEKQGLIR